LDTHSEKEFGHVEQFRTDADFHIDDFADGHGWLY
jgi:hypothetical protein